MNRIQIFISAFLLTFCLLFSVSALAQEDVSKLSEQANILLESNKPEEAAAIHEKMLLVDSMNYESNAWLGNYYYLLGQKKVEDEESRYDAIANPGKMQTALHMDELKSIYRNYYDKADDYAKRALNIRKNDHLQNMVESIESFKISVRLASPPEKKRGRK